MRLASSLRLCVAVTLIAAASLSSVSSTARAQALANHVDAPRVLQTLLPAPEVARDPLTLRVDQLTLQLKADAQHSRISSLRIQGVFTVLLGLVGVGFGTYVALDGVGMRQTTERSILSAIPFMFGFTYGFSGLRLFAADETFAEHTLHQIDQIRASRPLTAVDIARFESNLQTRAWFGRDRRITDGYMSVGVGVGGLAMFALAATGKLEGDALAFLITLGSVYVGLGTWRSLASFYGESTAEKHWRKYCEGVEAGQQRWLVP